MLICNELCVLTKNGSNKPENVFIQRLPGVVFKAKKSAGCRNTLHPVKPFGLVYNLVCVNFIDSSFFAFAMTDRAGLTKEGSVGCRV